MTARVRRLTGIRLEEIASDDDILALLNEAYLELCGVQEWPFLREQAEEQPVGDEVELPWPVQKFTSVLWSDADGTRRLSQVTIEEVERLELDPGRPRAYAVKDVDTLVLSPAPEGAGTVQFRGVRQASPMANGNDSPLFNEEFHVGLCYAAAARMLAEEGDDSGRAEQYVGEAQGVLSRMVQRYVVTHDTASFQMGSRRSRRGRAWRL